MRFNPNTVMTVQAGQRLLGGTFGYPHDGPPLRESVYRAMQSLERRGLVSKGARGLGSRHYRRWYLTQLGKERT